MSKLIIKNDLNTELSIEHLDGNGAISLGSKDFKYIRDTIKDISDIVANDGDVVMVKGYHEINDGGGGLFVYSSSEPKSNHNGGIVIDSSKTFPNDWTNKDELTDWFTGSNTTNGCWKRIFDDSINVKWFGAISGINATTYINNHMILMQAAKYAINKTLLFTDIFLVTDTVNFNTKELSSDGNPYNINIISDAGCGIYGVASYFTHLNKDVITVLSQSNVITGEFRLYDDTNSYTYANFRDIKILHILHTDRIMLDNVKVGGIKYTDNSTQIGAGINIWLYDCMSPRVNKCTIQYATKYGICVDKGTNTNVVNSDETLRISTSGVFDACYFGCGYPDATSRDECVSVTLGYGFTVVNSVFENNNKGRAIEVLNDNCYITSNWFEGVYDTILLNRGFGHIITGNLNLQSSPTNSALEGLGTYTIANVLPIGNSSVDTLNKSNIISPSYYWNLNQFQKLSVKGDIETDSNISAGYFCAKENNADMVLSIGTNDPAFINDQSVLQVHAPVNKVSHLRFTSGVSNDSNDYNTDIYTNMNDTNTGLRIDVNQDKRIDFTWENNPSLGFYMSGNTNKYFMPIGNNNTTLGDETHRWSDIYAVNCSFSGSVIMMTNLPTSDPGVAGQLWNDNGTPKISAG